MDFTNKTIGEIVADDFRTAAIFKKHGNRLLLPWWKNDR